MKKLIALSATLLAPASVFAQQMRPIHDANDAIIKFNSFLSAAVWILVSVAILFIVWNAVQFVRVGGDSEKRGEYQSAIMWGIVGVAVILSIWGLINIVRNTVPTDNATGYQNGQNSLNNLILQK
jgi:hypothetical protein